MFNYGKIPNPGATAPSDPLDPPAVSDGLAINYANSIEIIMRCNATKSRITREVSATAQVGLAAFGGVGAAYNWSKTTLTVLGLASAAIPQLQGIFDAKGRAEVYNQAANMIQDGIWEYYSLNSSPSSNILTSNGLTLAKKVSAAISLVDNTLVGQLPSAKQMRQAVEEMTPAGATKQVAGAPPTNAMVPAALQRAPTAPRTVPKRQMRQSTVAPQFPNERPVEVEAKAHEINNTIRAKAGSIEQLNRFCQKADLPPPTVPATGTDEAKLDDAKEVVMKQVREITEPQHIQKAADAAKEIFGSPNP